MVDGQQQQSPLASQRAKASGSRFSNVFPLGYRETFTQWWANVPAAVAEHNVLAFMPYLHDPPTQTETATHLTKPTADGHVADGETLPPTDSAAVASSPATDPYGPRRWKSNRVVLSGKNRALNEFSIERIGEPVKDNLVILHGYGAGLGLFYKNFEALSRPPGWRLFALDLLGMGRSSRPPFRIQAKDRAGSIKEAEDWFVDSLEEWRQARKLDRFTLMGHSLGGYMATCYALKYPGHLDKLILVSPVGIPEDPYAVQADLPPPPSSSLEQEFSEGADKTAASSGDSNNFLNARDRAAPQQQRQPLPKWLTYLWDANISPFSLVRWSGPLGPRFCSGWTTRRFQHLPPAEAQALHTYAYTLFKQRGSGEYALAYVLAPGAFARSPLIRRIGGVGRQLLPSSSPTDASPTDAPHTTAATSDTNGTSASPVTSTQTSVNDTNQRRETGLPVVLVYGENDWMDVKGGHAAVEKLNAAHKQALAEASPEARAQERGGGKVVVVPASGHHVYLDNAEGFNEAMLKELVSSETKS